MANSFLMFGSFYPEIGGRTVYVNDDGTYDLEVNGSTALTNKTEDWKTSGRIDSEKLSKIKEFCSNRLTRDSYVQDNTKGLIIQYKTPEKAYKIVNDPVWEELHTLLPELDQPKPGATQI